MVQHDHTHSAPTSPAAPTFLLSPTSPVPSLTPSVDLTPSSEANAVYNLHPIYHTSPTHPIVKLGVCSRNYEVLLEYDLGDKADVANNKFRDLDRKYSILQQLESYPRNIAIQTEVYGESINGNRHKIKGIDLVVFDIYDIDAKKFLPHKEVVAIAKEFGMPTVDVVSDDKPMTDLNIDTWVALASAQRYKGNLLAEGVVVKTCDGLEPYINFKVISPDYLVKHGI
jgi:hypothetical protein